MPDLVIVDWCRYRKCAVCSSETGEPCLSLRGLLAASGPVEVPMDEPHSARPMSKVASRA